MSEDKVSISVSELKTHLLRIMRAVAEGKSFEVTKNNVPIAVIYPHRSEQIPATGFSKIEVCGEFDTLNADEWTFDAHNLTGKNRG